MYGRSILEMFRLRASGSRNCPLHRGRCARHDKMVVDALSHDPEARLQEKELVAAAARIHLLSWAATLLTEPVEAGSAKNGIRLRRR